MRNRLNGHEPTEFRDKFRILFVAITVALSVLVVRLWYLQVVRGDELRQRSDNNSVRLRKITPPRGLIADTNGRILVDNQPSFNIVFVPNRVKDIHDVAGKLEQLYASRSMTLTTDLLLTKKSRPFVPVKLERNIGRDKLAIVETHAIDLPGLVVEVVPVRKYQGEDMMAHIIGYVGEVSPEELEEDDSGDYGIGDIVGKYGIEKYLDQFLRGRNGTEQVEVNVLGKEIKVLGRIDPSPGSNVVLTIDYSLQKVAWEALQGKTGAAVVMDPRDGSVLALVSTPSFDPNLFFGGISFEDWERISTDPGHPMENRAISGQYPPGSTYKPFIAAAALQEGLITPDTTFFCDGSFELGNRTYRCWQKNGHGRVDLHRAIVESCDVYFYNVGKILGVDTLAKYARAFGLGEPSGIDLPREKAGLIPTKQWKLERFKQPWQMGETISLSIGQGFNSVTPVQLLNAYCALANGGTLYRPRIIKRIEEADGQPLKVFEPEKKGTIPVSQANIAILNYALWGVVNETRGTGYALKRNESDICGKTGTAQVIGLPENEKARQAKRIAARFRDHALFVCFAPYKNPEIAIVVIVENAGHGGSVAAPIARKIIDTYFRNKKAPGEKEQVVAKPGEAALGG
jgi:penicillin-binding protein 2